MKNIIIRIDSYTNTAFTRLVSSAVCFATRRTFLKQPVSPPARKKSSNLKKTRVLCLSCNIVLKSPKKRTKKWELPDLNGWPSLYPISVTFRLEDLLRNLRNFHWTGIRNDTTTPSPHLPKNFLFGYIREFQPDRFYWVNCGGLLHILTSIEMSWGFVCSCLFLKLLPLNKWI